MAWGIPVPARVPVGGLGWGRALLSGAGVPADALGNLGDRYFDTSAQRWYLKRWVGNFVGDSLKIPDVLPADGVSSPWDAEFIFALPFTSAADADGSLWSMRNSGGFRRLRIGRNAGSGVLSFVLLATNGSSGVSTITSTVNVLNNGWHKVRFGIRASDFWLSVDGESEKAGAWSAGTWSPQTLVDTWVSDTPTDNPVLQCGFRGWNPNGLQHSVPVDDGAGSIALDRSGNGYHGVIADGAPNTFWAQTWVPMDLL